MQTRSCVQKKALARALGLPLHRIDGLVKAGILPAPGRYGWPVAECQRRFGLFLEAEAGIVTPAWIAAGHELTALGQAAKQALDTAIAGPTPDACRAAANAGNCFFSLWAFFVAVQGDTPGVDPMYREPAYRACFMNYGRTLAALGDLLDARAAVTFLN